MRDEALNELLEQRAWELFVAWNQPGDIAVKDGDRYRQYVPIADCFKAAKDFIDYCEARLYE